jgi:hypothetical protein
VEKNYQKYLTYKNAFEQINAAIKAGFYLEAITIEESMLTDRLFRFCRDHGYKRTFDRATLGNELDYLRDKLLDQLMAYEFTYLDDLYKFWNDRNTCLHQIAKSEPGTPTMDYDEFMGCANLIATNGKSLVNKVGGWSKKYRKSVISSV